MTGDRTDGAPAAPTWATWEQRRAARHAMESPAPGDGPDRAMEVLVVAQRTAEEHLRSARAEVEQIRARALASADEILRDAQAYADDIGRKAEQILAEAGTSAESIIRNAQERAEEAERRAMLNLSEARSRAERIDTDARLGAEELRRQAKAEYDEVLDRLQANRESLLRQIESLEQFDREYRQRLLEYMQGQMRALWADSPQVLGEPGKAPPVDGHGF